MTIDHNKLNMYTAIPKASKPPPTQKKSHKASKDIKMESRIIFNQKQRKRGAKEQRIEK